MVELKLVDPMDVAMSQASPCLESWSEVSKLLEEKIPDLVEGPQIQMITRHKTMKLEEKVDRILRLAINSTRPGEILLDKSFTVSFTEKRVFRHC